MVVVDERVNPDIAGAQGSVGVAMAPDGHFAAAYVEGNATDLGQEDVFVRLHAADGTPAPGIISVNPGTEKRSSPSIAMAANGDFVVAYTHVAGFDFGIRAQRFDAAGAAVGGELIVSAVGNRYRPRVAMAPDGRFAVAWDSIPHVEARWYAAHGTPVTGVLTVDQTGFAKNPDLARDSAGNFVVVWERTTLLDTPGRVKARRYSAIGGPSGGEFDAFTGNLNQPYPDPAVGLGDNGRLTVLASGGTVTNSLGTFSGLYGQRVDPSDALVGEPFRVNVSFGSSILFPGAAMDSDGDLLVAFEDQSGGGNKMYLRHYLPNGTAEGAAVLVGAGGDFNPKPRVATDGVCRAVIAFTSNDGAGFNAGGAFIRRARYAGAGKPCTTTPAPVGGTPAAAPGTAPKPALAALPAFASLVALPGAKKCVSRRRFSIRLRVPRDSTVTSAEVKVNGKRVTVRKGARLRSVVNLTKLPKGRFRMDIAMKLADGRIVKGTRTYRTCAVKRRARAGPRV